MRFGKLDDCERCSAEKPQKHVVWYARWAVKHVGWYAGFWGVWLKITVDIGTAAKAMPLGSKEALSHTCVLDLEQRSM